MNKWIERLTGLIFIAGLIILFGLVGTDDYYVEAGVEHSMDITKAILGVVMLIPFTVIHISKGDWIE